MNNIIIYCETNANGQVSEVSLELCSKGRQLATQMGFKLEAAVFGSKIPNIEAQLYPYGVDSILYADDERLAPYRTLPHFAILKGLLQEHTPEVVLFGATCIGRDLAPRISGALRCGLTADCVLLEVGSHTDVKTKTEYNNILLQIRPAFGGNIVATIVSPETRPQMATVREGVMKKEIFDPAFKGELVNIDAAKYLSSETECVKIISREIEEKKVNIKGASIIVAGGYGMGSKEGFEMLYKLADVLGGEVGASRAAVDAGFCERDRMIGQTGTTVRPKLYIACGISGAIQHRSGMEESGNIISINTDPNAPINAIADYTIIGDVKEVLPKLIAAYQANKK